MCKILARKGDICTRSRFMRLGELGVTALNSESPLRGPPSTAHIPFGWHVDRTIWLTEVDDETTPDEKHLRRVLGEKSLKRSGTVDILGHCVKASARQRNV
jgi:hypothetical protein